MTTSDFLAQMWDIEERIADFTVDALEEFEIAAEGLQMEINEIVSELETLRDEQEEKRDNMPESLQDSQVGELLQSRYEAVDEMIGELEAVDTDIDEDLSREEKEERLGEMETAFQGVGYNGS